MRRGGILVRDHSRCTKARRRRAQPEPRERWNRCMIPLAPRCGWLKPRGYCRWPLTWRWASRWSTGCARRCWPCGRLVLVIGVDAGRVADAAEARDEVGVPLGAAELAVGGRAQPGRLLHRDRVPDRVVLGLGELGRGDGPGRAVGPGAEQRGRAEQAPDVVGAERRCGTGRHGPPCAGRFRTGCRAGRSGRGPVRPRWPGAGRRCARGTWPRPGSSAAAGCRAWPPRSRPRRR